MHMIGSQFDELVRTQKRLRSWLSHQKHLMSLFFFFPRDYAERKVRSRAKSNSKKGCQHHAGETVAAIGQRAFANLSVSGRENSGPLPMYIL